MHILLTNDDGPPSDVSSPYILAFVHALERAGHDVSVIVPSEQRSWIGKAHLIGRDVQSSIYWPPSPPALGSSSEGDRQSNGVEGVKQQRQKQPWVLVDSTPASCAQLGLSGMFFKGRGKVDLGRNTTAVFALSSGTLGAALEASVCGYRAIALSFAFFDRTNDPTVVAEACRHAVRVCEWLAAQDPSAWDDGARLYSVNVPLKAGVSQRRVVWTRMLQNQWRHGACFEEIGPADEGTHPPGHEEAKVRRAEAKDQPARQEVNGTTVTTTNPAADTDTKDEWRTRHFKWAPRFTDVYDSVQAAGPGSDGWAVKEGETSITALRPNFMHVDGVEGEVKL